MWRSRKTENVAYPSKQTQRPVQQQNSPQMNSKQPQRNVQPQKEVQPQKGVQPSKKGQPKKQQPQQRHQQKEKQREGTPMEVDKMLPPWAASLKRSREEEEEEPPQRHSGRSSAERVMDKTRSLSVPASKGEDEEHVVKPRSLSASPARVPFPPPNLP